MPPMHNPCRYKLKDSLTDTRISGQDDTLVIHPKKKSGRGLLINLPCGDITLTHADNDSI